MYLTLLPGFLSPHFWERQGNVPALTRLMQVGGRATHLCCLLCCCLETLMQGVNARSAVQACHAGKHCSEAETGNL